MHYLIVEIKVKEILDADLLGEGTIRIGILNKESRIPLRAEDSGK